MPLLLRFARLLVLLALLPLARVALAEGNSPPPQLDFATYLGRPTMELNAAVATDRQGYIYIAGDTGFGQTTTPLPTMRNMNPHHLTNPANPSDRDIIVTKLSPDGQRVIYQTAFGGSGTDEALGIAVDSSGAAYITGVAGYWAGSSDFPLVNPIQEKHKDHEDAFVSKLSPDGSRLIYSTYLGSSGYDIGTAIAVSADGYACVTGRAGSDFPLHNSRQGYSGATDSFVVRLTPAGAAVYITFLGGQASDASTATWGQAIAEDAAGNCYVAGNTSARDFPTQNPIPTAPISPTAVINRAYVTKLSSDGQKLIYSTLIAGVGSDSVSALSLAADGTVYLAGQTSAADLPVAASPPYHYGSSDPPSSYVAHLSADGSGILNLAYLSANDALSPMALTLDPAGRVYLAGETATTNLPTLHPLQPYFGGASYWLGGDGFIIRFNPELASFDFASYYGGSDDDYINSLAANDDGSIVALGHTGSANLPLRRPLQAKYEGEWDHFVMRLSDDATPYILPNTGDTREWWLLLVGGAVCVGLGGGLRLGQWKARRVAC